MKSPPVRVGLTPEQVEAYRAYRRELLAVKRAAMTDAEREKQRDRWRRYYHKHKPK